MSLWIHLRKEICLITCVSNIEDQMQSIVLVRRPHLVSGFAFNILGQWKRYLEIVRISCLSFLQICQGATPTSDKARRPTPTTGDRGRRWRLIGKEGPASKVLSGTYENVAEVGTGRVALSMQRLRQGGILLQ